MCRCWRRRRQAKWPPRQCRRAPRTPHTDGQRRLPHAGRRRRRGAVRGSPHLTEQEFHGCGSACRSRWRRHTSSLHYLGAFDEGRGWAVCSDDADDDADFLAGEFPCRLVTSLASNESTPIRRGTLFIPTCSTRSSRGDRYCPPAISQTCARLCRSLAGRSTTRCLEGTPSNMTINQCFADLGVGEPLIKVLAARGIVGPFPIQVQTLPDTLAGRDVLGRGKTGSGKTLAFSIPLVTRLAVMRRQSKPTGLVLAPTRELASQIAATLEPLAAAYHLKVTTIFGGVPQNRQVAALKSGIDIVVVLPRRLEALMKQRIITLDAVGVTLVDEAVHMAPFGFLPGVTRILAATPAGGQRL